MTNHTLDWLNRAQPVPGTLAHRLTAGFFALNELLISSDGHRLHIYRRPPNTTTHFNARPAVAAMQIVIDRFATYDKIQTVILQPQDVAVYRNGRSLYAHVAGVTVDYDYFQQAQLHPGAPITAINLQSPTHNPRQILRLDLTDRHTAYIMPVATANDDCTPSTPREITLCRRW